jgi:heat shock protein HtpX
VTAPNLFEQQAGNRRRSTLLIAGFILFFAWVGFGGDWAWYLLTADAPPWQYHHLIPWIGVLAASFAAGTGWYAWRHGADRVLWATGAWELLEPATPGQQQLFNVVDEMAIASGIPRPRIWLVPDGDPNAFATGVSPDRANLAVTEGLLTTLSRDELQGVIAHEMAHIRNYDVRLMTLLAAMVGAIALMSDGMGRMLRGGFRTGGNRKGNPLGLVILVLWVFTLILAPAISRLLAMAVSRKREYLADATGAQFTRNPMALATALDKLGAADTPTRAINRGAAHLCIVDPLGSPFSDREGLVGDVFASHPPIRQRVIRLKGMAYQLRKQEGAVG